MQKLFLRNTTKHQDVLKKYNKISNNKYGDLLSRRTYLYVGLYIIIYTYNIIYRTSPLSLILCIPQYCIIILYIIKKEYRKACFYHLLFILLSVEARTAILTEEEIKLGMYSYGKVKFLGQIGYNHLIGIIIWISVLIKYPIIHYKDTLLYKFHQIVVLLAIGGISIGIVGLIFFNYSMKYFLGPTVYIITAYIYTDILLRLYHKKYIQKFYSHAIYLTIAAVISATICFHILDIYAQYSTEKSIIYNEMYTLTPCLLIALLQISNKRILIISSLICYGLNLYAGARGFQLIMTITAFIFFIYLLYTSNKFKFLKYAFSIFLLIYILNSTDIINQSSKLTSIKLEQLKSIITLFWGDTSFWERIQNMPESPLVRISEFLNILHNGISNPIGLIFGKGFGGYFIDSLNLFNGLKLLEAYPDEVIASGQYTTAHDVYPTVLLYNGIIGLFLILYIGIKYIKHIRNNFLVFAAFTLFLFSFYYNPMRLISCIFMLYAAEYKLTKEKYLTL